MDKSYLLSITSSSIKPWKGRVTLTLSLGDYAYS